MIPNAFERLLPWPAASMKSVTSFTRRTHKRLTNKIAKGKGMKASIYSALTIACASAALSACGNSAPSGEEVAPLVKDRWLVIAQMIQGKIDVSSAKVITMNCAQAGNEYACQGVLDIVGKKFTTKLNPATGRLESTLGDFEQKQNFNYKFAKGDKGWMLLDTL